MTLPNRGKIATLFGLFQIFVTFALKHFIGFLGKADLIIASTGNEKGAFMRKLITSLVIAVFGTVAYADDDGSLVVVELYTSEGCSSCPPADKMLTEIAGRDGVLALALHVDYWDYLGWKDQFSMAKFTKRQEYYNMALGSRYRLVTPQMIFHGQSYVAGAKAGKIEQHLEKLKDQSDKVLLDVKKEEAGYRVSISPLGLAVPAADVFIVQYTLNYVSKVKAGENRGLTLNHTNVVTSWERVGVWNGQRGWHIQQPFVEGTQAAVIVQTADSGPILAARKLQ